MSRGVGRRRADDGRRLSVDLHAVDKAAIDWAAEWMRQWRWYRSARRRHHYYMDVRRRDHTVGRSCRLSHQLISTSPPEILTFESPEISTSVPFSVSFPDEDMSTTPSFFIVTFEPPASIPVTTLLE